MRRDTSQLLLIVSDGRGIFLEGMEVSKTALKKELVSLMMFFYWIVTFLRAFRDSKRPRAIYQYHCNVAPRLPVSFHSQFSIGY